MGESVLIIHNLKNIQESYEAKGSKGHGRAITLGASLAKGKESLTLRVSSELTAVLPLEIGLNLATNNITGDKYVIFTKEGAELNTTNKKGERQVNYSCMRKSVLKEVFSILGLNIHPDIRYIIHLDGNTSKNEETFLHRINRIEKLNSATGVKTTVFPKSEYNEKEQL